MSVSMNHDQVRVFAQLLRELTGRDVKHSQILKQIAAAKSVAYDALMHRLKNRETERVELTKAELQSIATLLSAVSKRTIELAQVENAAALSVDDTSKPDIYSIWATFKRNAQGKIALFPFTPKKPGDLPTEDFGFGDANLVDAFRLAPIIANFDDGSRKEADVEISSAFTLKLLVVPAEGNKFKSSGLQAVDNLLNALTVSFAPKGTRYIADGCVFRPATLKRVPTVTAEMTRAIEQLQPLLKKMPLTITSGDQKPSSEQEDIQSNHNHSSSLTLLRHALNGMIFLQSIPVHEWRKEINSIEIEARDLTFQGHSGPLNDYKHLIQSLFDALKVIVGIYELAAMPVEDDRWKDVKGLLPLIENIILKDKQRERVGNSVHREQLARDINESIGRLRTMSQIFNETGEEQSDRTSAWISAVWELMRNPLWTVIDDIAIYVRKNPMTAYNGYRLSSWTPD
ncbi:hypothetical protein [Rhizobium sp. MHM7A]|uniref:hypothetical protein n=1 Tax=Rhizobium sp. MHM7A TaxID=2583233 RepID=UPI001106B92C|nr:hypothetical protein [Rhizobium sp. MHM7A]TLX15918.1 hypothetical protein FFR93_00970 [Rhizobium sp. MHM7A]